MGNKLKIASWNIDLKRKKDDKFIHIINDLLDNNEIVVLNEVCFKHKEIIDKIANERKNMFDYIVNKVNDVGYIMMFISKTRFEHITDGVEGQTIHIVSDGTLTVEHYKDSWGNIRTNTKANVILEKDETCHFSNTVHYQTSKNVVTGYTGKGKGFSFRIVFQK